MDEQNIYFRQNILPICAKLTILKLDYFTKLALNKGVYWLDLLKLTTFRKLTAISLFRIKIDQIFAYT